MTDKLDAIALEPTQVLTALPGGNALVVMRESPTGNFLGVPLSEFPTGGASPEPVQVTIWDGGIVGQAADLIMDGGVVGDGEGDAVADGGLAGQTGDGRVTQQFLRGDTTLWALPDVNLMQGQPGVVFDADTGDVQGMRIGKAVTSDPLATTPAAENPMLMFYPAADRDKLADIEPNATAAGVAGDEHAGITGNPHGTGIGDIVGLPDAIAGCAPAVHTHTPEQAGLGNVTNDAQLRANIRSYDEKTDPAAGDEMLLRDGATGAVRRFNWSRLPSGGAGGGGSNPAIVFVTTTTELLDAIAADKRVIYLAGASFDFNTPLLLNGMQLIGAGRGRTTLNWTGGAGPAITSKTPTARTYNSGLYGFTLNDNGSGTIGINWAAISAGYLQNLHVTGFDTQYALVGPNGYCVYNRLYDCAAQGGTTGFLIGGTGSNANSLIACRCNLVSGWGIDIVASNDTLISGCQVESGTSGIRVRSDAVADGDGTHICFNRFEALNGGSGGVAIQIAGANTCDAQIIANYIASTGGTISDAGTRTTIISMPYGAGGGPQLNMSSPYAIAGGAFRLSRSAAATDVPMLVLSDTNSGSGSPVTVEINTERATGVFLRGRRDGVTYSQLTADGKGLFSGGIGVGNSAAAASMGALTRKVEVFDASGASLGFIPIYAS